MQCQGARFGICIGVEPVRLVCQIAAIDQRQYSKVSCGSYIAGAQPKALHGIAIIRGCGMGMRHHCPYSAILQRENFVEWPVRQALFSPRPREGECVPVGLRQETAHACFLMLVSVTGRIASPATKLPL